MQDGQLAKLLRLWEAKYRPLLVMHADTDPQVQYVTRSGMPFTLVKMGQWWKRLHSTSLAPWPFTTMRGVRSVMIGAVLGDEPKAGGVDREAAARLLGNSTGVWGHYDKNKGSRLLIRGQQDVQDLRAQLLEENSSDPGEQHLNLHLHLAAWLQMHTIKTKTSMGSKT
jgi:hypothetical protein